MHRKRTVAWMGRLAVVLTALAVAYFFFMLDWSGRPFCHKQYYAGFGIWMDHDKTNAFPNAGGRSSDSLMAIREEMGGGTGWAKHYRYVPGLQQDDPGRLVLLYFDSPTRWTWHGQPPTVFEEKAWLVVPVDFTQGSRPMSGVGEMSERLTTEEFKRRLGETIEFVRTNSRPHWQEIVAEHTKFLESLEHARK